MIRLFEFGILRPKGSQGVRNENCGSVTGEKRKTIKKFSYDSRLRMRLALLTGDVKGCRRIGVTLTLPWPVVDSSVMDDFKDVMHRFRVAWLRAFPSSACVFRVELQQRGAPHVHMISWHSFPFSPYLSDTYFLLWFRAVRDLRGASYSDFARFGVRVDNVPNIGAAMRYLCDHATKKKQAQLGYKGKQWGILGRANFSFSLGISLPLGERETVLLLRQLRRLSRFRVVEKSDSPWHRFPCPFGSKKVGGKRLNRVVYFSRDNVFRICRANGWL